jgi:hypothetical protein
VKRAVIVAILAAALAVTPAAAAEEAPASDIHNPCPVPEGILRYDDLGMEYRVRLVLNGCDWYHGQPVVLNGSLARSSLVEPTEDSLTVRCEAGAPPFVDDHRNHPGEGPSGTMSPVADTRAAGEPRQEVRPVDNCVLDLHVPHPEVERAHYAGELHYPGPQGEVVERIAVDCVSITTVGGCSA